MGLLATAVSLGLEDAPRPSWDRDRRRLFESLRPDLIERMNFSHELLVGVKCRWTSREETNYERDITVPSADVKGDLAQAHDILKQLKIEGEIMWTTTRTDPNQFDFQVRRPGHFFFIKADLAQKHVTVRQAEVNQWGVIKALHSFTGVQMDDPRNSRDWALTSLWAFSMDAVAAGLIFMVLSSWYMWFELPQKRLPGAIVLGLGSLICGLFCLGLRWLF